MKLDYRRTFFIGLAFLSICAFWQLYDNLIPLILKNTFGIGDTVSGVIMAADNVLALFMLPLFGALSDKTRTPFGKRTPYIALGTVFAVVCMMLIPLADNSRNFVLFAIALGLTLVAMSTYRSPAVALMPDVTPKPLRSKANAVINLMGALGGVFTLVTVMVLVKSGDGQKPNYLPVYAAVAALMVVAVIVLLLTTRENKLSAEIAAQEPDAPAETGGKAAPMPKAVARSLVFILISVSFWFMGYNAVTTAFSKYAQEVWGMQGGGFASPLLLATAAAVVTYIPAGLIASRIGRKKTILGGVVIMGAAFALAAFLQQPSQLVVNILLGCVGIGWAAINVNSYPMVVEMSRGNDIGKYTGYYYTFSMAAQIVTPILSGFFLENVGYHTLFPYAAIFVALAFVTMLFVRHGDNRPQRPKELLELADVDQ